MIIIGYALLHYLVEVMKLSLCMFGILRCHCRDKNTMVKVGAAGAIVSVLLCQILKNFEMLSIVRGILVIVVVILLLKRGREFPLVIISFIVISVFDSLAISALCGVLKMKISTFMQSALLVQAANGISLIGCAILTCILTVIQRRNDANQRVSYSDGMLKRIVFLSGVVIVIAYYLGMLQVNVLHTSSSPFFQLAAVSVVFFLILSLCVIYIIQLNRYEKNQTKMLYYESLIQQQKKYYEELLKQEQKTKKLRHDIKSHLGVITSLVQTEDVNQVKTYLENLQQEYSTVEFHKTNNVIVDIVLGDIMRLFPEVKFQCEGIIPELDFMEDIDICILFSNLFRNAAEAVVETESKIVILNVKLLDHVVYIYEENSYMHKVEFEHGRPLTNKKDTSMHGVGTKNMFDVVEKYHGEIKFGVHANKVFHVDIILPIE